MSLAERDPQSNPERYAYIRFAIQQRRTLAVLGIAVAVLGVLQSLIQYAGATAEPTGARTHPFTATALVWIGTGIALHRQGKRSSEFKIYVTAVFLALLLTIVVGWLFGLPILSSHEFGTVSADTAAILSCFLLALLLRRDRTRLALVVLALAFALTLNSLIGKTYLARMFDGHMAGTTSISLVLILAAIATLFIHTPMLRVVLLKDELGRRTRILLMGSVIVPWLVGLLPLTIVDDKQIAERLAYATTLIIWSFALLTVYSGHQTEIASRKRRIAERRIRHIATHDSLTGLKNRYAINRLMAQRLEEFQSGGPRLGLILLDIDHFKAINDEGGHDVGDLVLSAIGDALHRSRGSRFVAGRWGGEEFICLFDVEFDSDLETIPRAIHAEIGALRPKSRRLSDGLYDGKEWRVTASIGVTRAFDGECSAERLLKRADVALYQAKENGRNRVEYHAEFLPIRAA